MKAPSKSNAPTKMDMTAPPFHLQGFVGCAFLLKVAVHNLPVAPPGDLFIPGLLRLVPCEAVDGRVYVTSKRLADSLGIILETAGGRKAKTAHVRDPGQIRL